MPRGRNDCHASLALGLFAGLVCYIASAGAATADAPTSRRAHARGIARVDPARRPVSRSSWSPASPWSKTRSLSTGGPTASSGSSRWVTTRWASTARASPAASSGSSKTRTATAATTSRRRFWTASDFRPASCPGAGGVLVACAPDIFYAEDRDGDGKADHREVLFTGFGQGNQQHRLNGFELGLDGWIYGANGDSDGNVRSLKTGQDDLDQRPRFPVSARHGRIRGRERSDPVRPAPRRLGPLVWQQQPQSGAGTTSSPITTSVATRSFAPPDPRQTLEPDTRLYPASRTLPRFNDLHAANHVTSANSPTPYRDELFGPEFATSLFVSEPVHNLVHRMVLEPEGVSFRGHRAPGETTASSSPRATTGSGPPCSRRVPTERSGSPTCIGRSSNIPNGFPMTGKKRLDLRAGSEQGRIYRVYPGRSQAPVDSTARQARYGPARGRARERRAAGSATRPSGCSCTGRDPAAIAPCERWRSRQNDRRRGFRRSGRWPISTVSTSPRPWPDSKTPIPRVREGVIAAAWPLAQAIVDASWTHSDPPGRRCRRSRPFSGRAGARRLREEPRRPGAGAAGPARCERSVDAGRDPELGGPARRHTAARACCATTPRARPTRRSRRRSSGRS